MTASTAATAKSDKSVANPTYTPLTPRPDGFPTFESFYPFYLGEHSNPTCRRLHLVGTGISTLILTRVLLASLPQLALSPAAPRQLRDLAPALSPLRLAAPLWQWLAAGVGQGYLFAWIGHFFFEKNKPATFTHPLYSFMGDVRMLSEVVAGKRRP